MSLLIAFFAGGEQQFSPKCGAFQLPFLHSEDYFPANGRFRMHLARRIEHLCLHCLLRQFSGLLTQLF
jgi:hypothetical protein